jgi:hypothetical protein
MEISSYLTCCSVLLRAVAPAIWAHDLAPDIEWKVIYVGSAEDQQHDQELDSILVGPVPVGTAKFTLEVRYRPLPKFAMLVPQGWHQRLLFEVCGSKRPVWPAATPLGAAECGSMN